MLFFIGSDGVDQIIGAHMREKQYYDKAGIWIWALNKTFLVWDLMLGLEKVEFSQGVYCI